MDTLSRRERQILDILYRRGRATAAEIQQAMPDAPGYSATRALLRVLEEKGHVRHQADGTRYVFLPRVPRDKARITALKHLLKTFFAGSAGEAAAALVGSASADLRSRIWRAALVSMVLAAVPLPAPEAVRISVSSGFGAGVGSTLPGYAPPWLQWAWAAGSLLIL